MGLVYLEEIHFAALRPSFITPARSVPTPRRRYLRHRSGGDDEGDDGDGDGDDGAPHPPQPASLQHSLMIIGRFHPAADFELPQRYKRPTMLLV